MITKDKYTFCIGEDGVLSYTLCILGEDTAHIYVNKHNELRFRILGQPATTIANNILYSTAMVKDGYIYIYTINKINEVNVYYNRYLRPGFAKELITTLENPYHISFCRNETHYYLMLEDEAHTLKILKSTDPLFATSQKIYTRTQLNGFKYYQKPNIDYHPILDKIAITAELVYKGKQENIDLFYTYA